MLQPYTVEEEFPYMIKTLNLYFCAVLVSCLQ